MKDIPGYEGRYAATSCGRVWSYLSNRFMSLSKNVDGYLTVNLSDKNHKKKKCLVHRLVALTYIPNPDGLPHINHKDENPSNNCLQNLEWCDAYYNNHYGHHIENSSRYNPVYCIELNKTFKCQKEAAKEFKINPENINRCCKGKQKTAGGYHWRYAND